MAVLSQFRELFKLSARHFQRIESSCGVSGSQLWGMAELQAKPGLKISELASALSIQLSTASNLLDKLEKRGLIRRERADADQRVVRVYLTADGEAIVDKAPKPVHGIIPDALSKLPTEVLFRLNQDLELLLQSSAVRDHRAALTPLADI
jgi:DNA-binding MarR family transcriptional regulator